MTKQEDKAIKKTMTSPSNWARNNGPVKYIRKGRKNAKKQLSRSRRRVDGAVVDAQVAESADAPDSKSGASKGA